MKPDFVIFSDGSVRPNGAGYGTIVINNKNMKFTEFGGELHTHSIAFAEAWAFMRGLQFINGYCRKKGLKHPIILIVTDNKLNVDIFQHYIPEKWDLSDPDCWRKTDGSKVKNQDLYKSILRLVEEYGMTIHFIHINSHVKRVAWEKIQAKIEQQTGLEASQELCEMFRQMNRRADEMACLQSVKATVSNNQYLLSDLPRLKWKHMDTFDDPDPEEE